VSDNEILKMVNDRLGALTEQLGVVAQQVNQLVGKQDMRDILCEKHGESLEVVNALLFGRDKEGNPGLVADFAVVKKESGETSKFVNSVKNAVIFGSVSWLAWAIMAHLFPTATRLSS
jgi:hypothetical protein